MPTQQPEPTDFNFEKPEYDLDVNPVDYFNHHVDWQTVINGNKSLVIEDETIYCGKKQCIIDGYKIRFPESNALKIPASKQLTKFQLYARLNFKSNYRKAQAHIEHKFLNRKVPFIRVGCDYFKVISKTDQYGIERKTIKGWKKEEFKQDYGASALSQVSLFDDFCIVPDNMNYKSVVAGSYNLYAPFIHKPAEHEVTEQDIPVTLNFLHHIFGDQLIHGIKYFQIIYQYPKQILPILCLISSERQTGKTTFLNWMDMIFGDNFVLINSEELVNQFNSSYAYKNLIALDEAVVEKSHAIEKMKSLGTAKSISVNNKWVQQFSIPFYGKLIICSNKETDFIRIDEEEIRFWIRKIPVISQINTTIEQDLRAEIPLFLKFLNQQPVPDFSKSRMVFTSDEIDNDRLKALKKESMSNLYKEMVIKIEDYFFKHSDYKQFSCTASDIKDEWFPKENKYSAHYISKVLQMDFKIEQVNSTYTRFNDGTAKYKGKFYTFYRKDFVVDSTPEQEEIDWSKAPPF